MRELKFRAWDKKEKRWLGVNLHMSVTDGTLWWQYGYGCEILSAEERENIELMQYTGRKDKKGKEIYEGDLIQNKPFPNFVVKYENGNWNYAHMHRASYGDTSEWLTIPEKEWLIIGNIKENPELMEVEQEDFYNDFHKTGGGGERQ